MFVAGLIPYPDGEGNSDLAIWTREWKMFELRPMYAALAETIIKHRGLLMDKWSTKNIQW